MLMDTLITALIALSVLWKTTQLGKESCAMALGKATQEFLKEFFSFYARGPKCVLQKTAGGTFQNIWHSEPNRPAVLVILWRVLGHLKFPGLHLTYDTLHALYVCALVWRQLHKSQAIMKWLGYCQFPKFIHLKHMSATKGASWGKLTVLAKIRF